MYVHTFARNLRIRSVKYYKCISRSESKLSGSLKNLLMLHKKNYLYVDVIYINITRSVGRFDPRIKQVKFILMTNTCIWKIPKCWILILSFCRLYFAAHYWGLQKEGSGDITILCVIVGMLYNPRRGSF